MATIIVYDLMHKEVEVCVDDMMVNSKTREEHMIALKKFFQRVDRYNHILNRKNCVFRVTFGNLLGYTMGNRGIEVDLGNIKAITEMILPKIVKEVRAFLRKINYISRFIAKLTSVCEPIFKLLMKNQPVE